MNALKTWTVRRDDCVIVVTAENVDTAVGILQRHHGLAIKKDQLIPLPTNHRYVRILRANE